MRASDRSVTWWIQRANSRGFMLNNLFQLDSGIFQANFRSKDNASFTTFGFGRYPQLALKNALADKGNDSMPKRRRPRLPKWMRK